MGKKFGYSWIGFCYAELKQYEQAIPYYQKAIAEGRDDNVRYCNIAYCYRELKQYEQAITYYQKAIADGCDYSVMSNKMGSCYEGLGIYKEAMNYYRKASEMGNAISTCHIALLYTYGHGVSVDYLKAQEYLKKAKEQITDNQDSYRYLDFQGEVNLKFGKYDEAKMVWEELKSKYPDKIEILAKRDSEVFVLAMERGLNMIDTDIPETNTKNENTFAFIIANENYKRIANVPFAINDGKIVAEYCRKTLGIPEKNVHLLCDASLGDMKYNTNLIKQIADAYDGEAKFIIYYAGHGIPAENQEQAFLLPIDGYGADDTGYSLNDLYRDLGNLKSQSVFVLLDACFSGVQRNGEMLVSARGVAIKAKSAMPKGNMVVFSAAQGDETAYPDKENNHGLFTYFFLKKLQESKGDCSIGELADYVISNVKKSSIVLNGKLQTPTISVSDDLTNSWKSVKLK